MLLCFTLALLNKIPFIPLFIQPQERQGSQKEQKCIRNLYLYESDALLFNQILTKLKNYSKPLIYAHLRCVIVIPSILSYLPNIVIPSELFRELKFIYSEKATKFCEISTVGLTVTKEATVGYSPHCWYIEPRNREKSLTLI